MPHRAQGSGPPPPPARASGTAVPSTARPVTCRPSPDVTSSSSCLCPESVLQLVSAAPAGTGSDTGHMVLCSAASAAGPPRPVSTSRRCTGATTRPAPCLAAQCPPRAQRAPASPTPLPRELRGHLRGPSNTLLPDAPGEHTWHTQGRRTGTGDIRAILTRDEDWGGGALATPLHLQTGTGCLGRGQTDGQ